MSDSCFTRYGISKCFLILYGVVRAIFSFQELERIVAFLGFLFVVSLNNLGSNALRHQFFLLVIIAWNVFERNIASKSIGWLLLVCASPNCLSSMSIKPASLRYSAYSLFNPIPYYKPFQIILQVDLTSVDIYSKIVIG
jgi:hypothetical protein